MQGYYPFGGTFQNYTSTNPKNNYLYNEGSELQPELQVYQTEFRMHDPWLGRWWQIDPLASERESPYVSMGNNPILYNDPLGDTINVSQAQQFDRDNGTDYVGRIIGDLQEQTGLTYTIDSNGNLLYSKDDDGNAIVATDSDGNENGSSILRSALIKGIDSENTGNFSLVESGGSQGQGLNFQLDINEVNSFVKGASHDLNNKTLGFGLTFAHELLHTDIGLGRLHGNELNAWGKTGRIVDVMNVIRGQLGSDYGQRLSYLALTQDGVTYIPFDTGNRKSLYRRFLQLKTPLGVGKTRPPFLMPTEGKFIGF